jgi:hypothetical protein
MYLPKPPRRVKLPPWQRAAKPIEKEGKVGKAQTAFNRRKMAEWRFRYGAGLASAISGQTGQLVVGHIEDRSLEPSLRTVDSNVAPITWAENNRMKTDHAYRAAAQREMRAWVAQDLLRRRSR